MKTIIQENHYQKKLWEGACFERELKSGKLNELLGNEAELKKWREASLEKVKRKYFECEASTRTFPSLSGRIKFKLASSYAVSLARHYEMNVHVRVSDSLGIIELSCDEIMFDTVWKDNDRKRHFVLLFLLASGVCLRSRAERGNTFLMIWMSFDLERRFQM